MFIPKDKIKKREYRNIDGITGKVTKFDQKLFDKYDVRARVITKNVLKDAVKDNEDEYGEDMIFTIKKFPYKYLELQVCALWENDYPFEYPFIYARKMRFSKKTLFLTFNRYFTQVIIFGRDSVSETQSRLKKYDREHVHFVPWGKIMKMNTSCLTVNSIRRYSGEFIESDSSDQSVEEDADADNEYNDDIKN
jgi:hypothetical protein